MEGGFESRYFIFKDLRNYIFFSLIKKKKEKKNLWEFFH